MKKEVPLSEDKKELRRRAEKRLPRKKTAIDIPAAEIDQKSLLHELQVHQIELEMQNEELQRIQRELEAEKERYADLYKFAPTGYMTLTEQGLVLEANLTAANLLGVASKELIGQPLTKFILAEDQDIYYRYRKDLLKKGEKHRCELRMQGPAGETFWAGLEATVFLDVRRGPLECRIVMGDITERKQAEEELHRSRDAIEAANRSLKAANEELKLHRDHLEELVQSRTKELAAARDEAEGANRAKSAFLANMGHEMRTPLNHIMGTAYLLKSDTREKRTREGLAMIQESSRQLLGLINDILNFTRIEAGRIQIESVDFKPVAMLERVEEGIRQIAAAKGLEFVHEIDPELPSWLKGDLVRLWQILEHLLSNAVKFSERGRITLRVRQTEFSKKDVTLRFEVEDQGIGIAPEQQAGLFQLFSQGDSSSTRKYGGTGLGLALSRRLVSLMAGDMGVISTPGEGSTFWFSVRLPIGAMPSAGKADAQAVDWNQARKTVAYLENLLADGEMRARNLWEEFRGLLAPILQDRAAAFEEAMETFDFEVALQLLREVIADNEGRGR